VDAVGDPQETTLNYKEIEEDFESLSSSLSMVGDPGSDCTTSILVNTYPDETTREMLVLQSTKKSYDKNPINSHNGMKPNIIVPL